MYTLAIICYERYGTQEYIDFKILDDILKKVNEWITDMDINFNKIDINDSSDNNFDNTNKNISVTEIIIVNKNNHMIIFDGDFTEYIITGVDANEQIIIKEFIDSIKFIHCTKTITIEDEIYNQL